MPTIEELFDLEALLNEAALRFDGYEFMDAEPATRTPYYFRGQWERLITNPDLRASTEDLMASLFFYQRSGPREIGWFAFRDKEHLAGLRLWLRLWERPTPEAWRFDEYAAKWDLRTEPEKAHAAEVVRHWLADGQGTWSPVTSA